KDSELCYLPVFLYRLGFVRTTGRPRPRRFIEFLRAQFPQSPELKREESRIIVPYQFSLGHRHSWLCVFSRNYPAAQDCVRSIFCAAPSQPKDNCERVNVCFISTHGRDRNPCFLRLHATRSEALRRYSSGAYPFFAYHCSYCFARRGNFSRTNGKNCFAEDGIKNRTPEKNHSAPASFAAAATASSSPSPSVIPGTNGDADTPTANPASCNSFTAASRRSGRGARGSSIRASLGRIVVTVMSICSEDRVAIFFSTSMSRTI